MGRQGLSQIGPSLSQWERQPQPRQMPKFKLAFKFESKLAIALLLLGSIGTELATGKPAAALPGQKADDVAAWIQAHPTLQPALGERLRVHRTDTAAQRFTFEASRLSPGRSLEPGVVGEIRSEKIELFDIINGVTRERLEESLRVIYGADIYRDYAEAESIYTYPNADTFRASRNSPLLTFLEGELRQGDRYAYWVEVARNPAGVNYSGRITVLLPQDVAGLEAQLRDR